MKKIYLASVFMSIILLVSGCKNDIKENNSDSRDKQNSNLYATHFTITNRDNYSVLSINNGQYTYVLQKDGAIIPDSLRHFPVIQVPLNNIIVASTTHLSGLEMLGVSDKLIAFPNTKYISSELFRQAIEKGKIEEIGNGMQLNTEKVLALHPRLLMVSSMGRDQKNDKIFTQHNIPVLYNADWLEKSPLGRAEWLKVFGVLFDKKQLSDSLFNQIVQNYKEVQKKSKSGLHPLVFQGGQFGDKWFVPGGKSYAVKLINDAGGRYIWQDNKNTGSINLNYENVLLQLPQVDVWLNPGMIENKTQLEKEIPQSKNFAAFKNNRIYSYNLTKGKTGGVIYFESSNAHPDWVLDDLYHIFNPDKNSDYNFHFYKELP